MEQLRTKVLLALLALAVAFGSASVAQAQVTYQVTTVPTFVITTGRAEALGSIRITATNNAAGALTIASTIQYTFVSVGCDNATASGMSLFTSADFAAAAIQSVTNTASGCVVAVTSPANVAVVNNASFVELRNVRGRIDLFSGSNSGGINTATLGANIFGSLSATPANSSLFTVPNQGVVGITAIGLQFVSTTAGTALQCIGQTAAPSLTLREGFNGAFVQHVTSAQLTGPPVAGGAGNGRPVAGATNNTQIRIIVSGLPTGVTLSWPALALVTTTATMPAFTTANTAGSGSRLERFTTATATSATQTYDYVCGDQATCDLNTETFTIGTVANPITMAVTPTSQFGTATVQIRLFPDLITGDATSVTSAVAAVAAARPRFNDPLIPSPGSAIATNSPCRTSLLWPYVVARYPQGSTSTGAAQPGSFDTGLAVANTGFDNPAFVSGCPLASGDCGAGAPPAGSCRWYAFQQISTHDASTGNTGTGTQTSPTAVTRGPTGIKSGDTDVLSATAIVGTNAWQGYMITVCDFQFGHGFAFLFENALTAGQLPVNAQGYLPLVIPDPILRGGRVANDPSCIGATGVKVLSEALATVVTCAQAGEGLVQ